LSSRPPQAPQSFERSREHAFGSTGEERALRELALDFVEREVIPREAEIERTGVIPADLLARIAALGFFGLGIPSAFGGLGAKTFAYALVCEALGRSHGAVRSAITVQNGLGVRALVTAGTVAQKDRWLRDLASGRRRACFCLSEPGAGSDAAAMSTSARFEGGRWILDGRKHFISWAEDADLFSVWARSDPAKRARGGITAFVVERGTPGLRVHPARTTMANRATPLCDVSFDGCEVPDENRIGEVGDGFRHAMGALDVARLGIAAAAIGGARRLLSLGAAYAKERHTFGAPIAQNQAIQWMLADSATDLYAAECMTFETARRHDAGEHVSADAAMCKLFATEMAFCVADRALQIHGALGLTDDLPIERMFRDLRVMRIADGTSEIQRRIIARAVLGED
jgi:acyl-CoA dehydrogenase